MAQEKIYSERMLLDFCAQTLLGAGLSQAGAEIVAETLVFAELRGIKSHGLIRLATYLERLQAGIMERQATILRERDEGAAALLDARNTFGQIAGFEAMTLALAKAAEYGAGVVGVKNSNHFGVAAYFAMMALKVDMIGFVLTNASPAMAVYGTRTPLIGTNPLAWAVPAGNYPAIVLDMSTSMVARGKIRNAALKGEEIPLGWALDKNGHPTTDAKSALEGTLEPVGGVKGSALSLIIDLVCGVLTDTILTGGVKNITDLSGPAKTGHFFLAINIARFIDPGLFKANVDRVIAGIKGMPKLGETEVFLPGEIEHRSTLQRRKEGISVSPLTLASLNRTAGIFGVRPLQ